MKKQQKNQKIYFFYNPSNQNYNLNFDLVKENKYTMQQIAQLLNMDCQEVNRQFNLMIKESNYCLFN